MTIQAPEQAQLWIALVTKQNSGSWDIVLHGYFWPSQDRRSIPGVTDEHPAVMDYDMRVRWNQAMRDELLLPLLPQALSMVLANLNNDQALALVRSISESKIVQGNLNSITKKHLLLPKVMVDGALWETHSSKELCILSIPRWKDAPSDARELFLSILNDGTSDSIFIDHDSPRIGGDVGVWPHDWIERFLDCVTLEAFQNPQRLRWVGDLLKHVTGFPCDPKDNRATLAASWLVLRISEGALDLIKKGSAYEYLDDLRSAWRYVFSALPQVWVVSAPVTTHRAVC
jgi:hypothetical protein